MLELLPLTEEKRLEELEVIIDTGFKTFVNVGTALLEIRDSRLYRRDYATFEDYCRDRWGMARRHAYRLIDAANAVSNVSNWTQTLPVTESQARPLTSLPPEQQIQAWQVAVDTAPEGKITAAHVQAVVSEMQEREILDAAKRIQAEKREQRRAERIDIITHEPVQLDSLGPFNVIYADPPWRYDYSVSSSREIEKQYPTMSIEEICSLPVASISADDCVLLLWATSPKLAEAIKVVESWGFTYKTCMVWVKDKIGMGYYARQQHELLLVATRGNLPTPEPENRPASVIYGERREHSSKPLEFYEVIERMYPEYSRVELFCREPRSGWYSWGNQA